MEGDGSAGRTVWEGQELDWPPARGGTGASLWVRISRQTNVGAVLAGICWRPPVPEEDDEEAFFKQVKAA